MNAKWVKRILPVVLLAGAAVWIIAQFGDDQGGDATAPAPVGQVWTCSMHPQVRLPRPGKCPICSMPLISAKPAAPAKANANGGAESMLMLSDHARAMASVETAPVERRKLTREVRAVGKVQFNETGLAVINSRVEGYVERLYVDFTGVPVKKGDHLVDIYSPDLIVAQQELLVGLAGTGNPALIESSKLKLLRWGMTQAQIDALVQERKLSERVTLLSPIDGTVIERIAVQQGMVKAGEMLYKLANLESVWVYLDIYESELAWVQTGQTVEIAAEANPGLKFDGRIWFINPVLTEETRTVKVLVNVANAEQKLKPGMFVSTTIRAGLLADGQLAPTGVEGMWTCPMHPQVLKPEAGPCPVCKMALTQIPAAAKTIAPGDELVLAVPASAVLDSGARTIAYVEHAQGEYIAVELKLGSRAGDFYPVLDGLKEGDRVAVRGSFLLDSQFQIQGLPSLFVAKGQAPAAGHQHGTATSAPAAPARSAKPKAQEHKH